MLVSINRTAGLPAAIAVVAAMGAAWPAAAETLADAIAMAYQSNPTLQSDRAELRQLDNLYGESRAAWWPSIAVQGTAQYSERSQTSLFGDRTRVHPNEGGLSLTIDQTLFSAGRVAAGVRAAESDVYAGRQALVGNEQSLVGSVIRAYADVLRDARLVALYQGQLAALTQYLDETELRFKARDVTETDVMQSRSQLEGVRTQLSLAQGQLQVSRAGYAALVGQSPGELAPLPPLPGLPATVDEAFDLAEQSNPALLEARYNEQASRMRVTAAKAANRPTVSLRGTVGTAAPISPYVVEDFDPSVSAVATVTQPLYSGSNRFRIGRAVEVNASDRARVEVARRQAIQSVSQAWSQMSTNQGGAKSAAAAVDASARYFDDMKAEYGIGQRGTLDVLTAEQTVRNNQVLLAQTEHDAYVSAAFLLSSIGRLRAQDLIDGLTVYDPSKSFRKARRAGPLWIGALNAVDGVLAPAARTLPPPAAPAAPPPTSMKPATQPIPDTLSEVVTTAPAAANRRPAPR